MSRFSEVVWSGCGKGLLNAHNKVESLNWAGSVVDNSFVTRVRKESDFYDFFGDKVKEYPVSYKGFYCKEIEINIVGKITSKNALDNLIDMIKSKFENDFKTITPAVGEKMKNTIEFIKSNFEPESEE